MTAFIAVLRNDMYRLMEEKARMLLMQVMIAGAVVIAILMSTRPASAGNIALVLAGGEVSLASPYLHVTVLEETPPMSALISNQYDAIVTFSDHSYHIETVKSDSFRETLEAVLRDPTGYHDEALSMRETGSNILGYLTMFLLMQGVYLMFLFAEDKEQKQLLRISSSPISLTAYMAAHSLFTFLMLFLPTLVILSAVRLIMNADMGMGFIQYSFLLGIICALAAAFPLFLNSLFKSSDSANMSGSAIVVMTSILAGSFYSFEKDNKLLEAIIKVLPQKSYLTIIEAAQEGRLFQLAVPQVLYIALLIFAFFIFAVMNTRREYIRSN